MLIFIASFVFVSLKAFQQLNVVGGHYRLVIPTGFLMAIAEITIVLEVVEQSSLWSTIPMGLGGSLGAILSMYLHKKYIRKEKIMAKS